MPFTLTVAIVVQVETEAARFLSSLVQHRLRTRQLNRTRPHLRTKTHSLFNRKLRGSREQIYSEENGTL